MDVFLSILQQCSSILLVHMDVTDIGNLIDAMRSVKLDDDNTEYWVNIIQNNLCLTTIMSKQAVLDRFNAVVDRCQTECKPYFDYFSKPRKISIIRLENNASTIPKIIPIKNGFENILNCKSGDKVNINDVKESKESDECKWQQSNNFDKTDDNNGNDYLDEIEIAKQILIKHNYCKNDENIKKTNYIGSISEIEYPKSEIIPKLSHECVIKFKHRILRNWRIFKRYSRNRDVCMQRVIESACRRKNIVVNEDGTPKYHEYDIQFGVKIGKNMSNIKDCALFLLANGKRRYGSDKRLNAANIIFSKILLSNIFDAKIIVIFDRLEQTGWYQNKLMIPARRYSQKIYWIPVVDPSFVLAFNID